jgi:ubiquinone/menaquinone biosynthesis C-methylase UbiE
MSGAPVADDFSAVTEVAGEAVRRDAVEKMYARYSFAAAHADQRDVLDVACGSGQGLALVTSRAKSVIGGDYTLSPVLAAARHYGSRLRFVCLDAQCLPFADGSFDLVLCYEALYYFPDCERFVQEAARVLRDDGELIVVSVNPEWSGFNKSPFSVRYHTAGELKALLERHSFRADVRGAFADHDAGIVPRSIRMLRRIAVGLHLVPRTMRAKRLLKRLFYGRLVILPAELEPGGLMVPPLESIPARERASHTVLYAVGTKIGSLNS